MSIDQRDIDAEIERFYEEVRAFHLGRLWTA